jgi:hypothetical protein
LDCAEQFKKVVATESDAQWCAFVLADNLLFSALSIGLVLGDEGYLARLEGEFAK